MEEDNQLEQITLGGGCFWCLEAQFKTLPGVRRVVAGYAGGTADHPTYAQVCSGQTGHAEVVQIHFHAKTTTTGQVLQAFWRCHDPTQLNRQGADVGSQYRSIILYHTDEQKRLAEQYKTNLMDHKVYGEKAVVTEIAPLVRFYEAEAQHQDYFRRNMDQPYCTFVIKPKLEHFAAAFC